MGRPRQEPSFYEGDEWLGKRIFNHIQTNAIYDEVGCYSLEVGWHGLLMYESIPYIVSYIGETFIYKYYTSQTAARKAWDHICNKVERWYIKNDNF